jgi:hypothetical protein
VPKNSLFGRKQFLLATPNLRREGLDCRETSGTDIAEISKFPVKFPVLRELPRRVVRARVSCFADGSIDEVYRRGSAPTCPNPA